MSQPGIRAVQIVSGVPKTLASDLPIFSGAQILVLLVGCSRDTIGSCCGEESRKALES